MLALAALLALAPQDRTACPSREAVLTFVSSAADVAHQTLWVSRDAGATWKKAAEAGVDAQWGEWAGGRIRCSVRVSEDGKYDFFAQLGDALSNTGEPPRANESRAVARLDFAAAPAARIAWEEPRAAGTWTGGQNVSLRWSASGAELRERSVELRYSTDGRAWITITKGLELSGSYGWVVPGVETARLVLRASARGRSGDEVVADSAPLSVRAGGRPEIAKARALYDRARVLHAQGRAVEAQLKYQEALAAWPEFGEVYNDLGKLHAEQRDYPKALEHFLRARKSCPSDPTPYVNAGRMEALLGLLDDALADLRDAVELGLEKEERTAVLAAETLWSVARSATAAKDPDRAREACRLILRIRHASRATRAKAEQALDWLK
jgi:tetratricopeptide (TPR) repeat protein